MMTSCRDSTNTCFGNLIFSLLFSLHSLKIFVCMIRVVLFFKSITAIVCSASAPQIVFDLRATDYGLMIPTSSSDTTVLIEEHILNLNFDDTRNVAHDFVETVLISSNESLVRITTPRDPVNHVDISPASMFARTYGTAMIVPLVESATSGLFYLLAGVSQPEQHCLDNAMGMVAIRPGNIKLTGRISLIMDNLVSTTATSESRRQVWSIADTGAVFKIDTTSIYDTVPSSIYNAIVREMVSLTGRDDLDAITTGMDLSDIIPRLPSIEYTIFEFDGSEEVAVKIRLTAEDYLVFSSHNQMYEMKLWPSEDDDVYELGTNFLKTTSVFIDYNRLVMGFCEPL